MLSSFFCMMKAHARKQYIKANFKYRKIDIVSTHAPQDNKSYLTVSNGAIINSFGKNTLLSRTSVLI